MADRPRDPRRAGSALRTIALLAAASAVGAVLAAPTDSERMAAAGDALLASLTDEQRASASFAFESPERLRWHFIPVEMFERHGVMLKAMSPTQRERAHDLLRAGLSQRGYLTATQIIQLEDVLQALEAGGRFARDRDEYAFAIFGDPAPGGTWGWRFEGHHLSLHFTIVDGDVAVASPAFVGSNPAEVREGPLRGRRVLGDREDAARALLDALDEGQRRTATISETAPRDIVTGSDVDIDRLSPVGITAGVLSTAQRDLLVALIEVYASMMTDDVARARMDEIRQAGVAGVSFAWAGSWERGGPHYYRVQGPSFLIEYDNTQNDANHVHSVWRDFDGDFGRDLLRDHLEQIPH